MISTDLRNDPLKAEVLKRVYARFPNKLGLHKFTTKSDECAQCSTKFWDWLTETDKGIFHGPMICNAIGPDEVAKFRTGTETL